MLKLACNCARAKVLISSLFERYNSLYPHVQLELVADETISMQHTLKNGKLDCFFGINGEYDDTMESVLLSTEDFYLMASDAYIRRYTDLQPERIMASGEKIDLSCFQGLPFIMNHSMSTAQPLLQQFMAARNINVNNVLYTSEYDIAEQVCRNGQAAFFCPQFLVRSFVEKNTFYHTDKYVYAFPISGLAASVHFSLVYDKLRHYPKYAMDFFSIVPDIVCSCLHLEKENVV